MAAGSPEVERLGLNNVFEFDIKIQLKVKPVSDERCIVRDSGRGGRP